MNLHFLNLVKNTQFGLSFLKLGLCFRLGSLLSPHAEFGFGWVLSLDLMYPLRGLVPKFGLFFLRKLPFLAAGDNQLIKSIEMIPPKRKKESSKVNNPKG